MNAACMDSLFLGPNGGQSEARRALGKGDLDDFKWTRRVYLPNAWHNITNTSRDSHNRARGYI
jgi:hypothetical protein